MLYAGSSLEMKNGSDALRQWLNADLAQAAGAHRSAMKRSNTSKSSMKVSSRCGTRSCQRVRSPGVADRRLHEAKIARAPIGADDEAIAQVLDLILMVALVRQENVERRATGSSASAYHHSEETVLSMWMKMKRSDLDLATPV